MITKSSLRRVKQRSVAVLSWLSWVDVYDLFIPASVENDTVSLTRWGFNFAASIFAAFLIGTLIIILDISVLSVLFPESVSQRIAIRGIFLLGSYFPGLAVSKAIRAMKQWYAHLAEGEEKEKTKRVGSLIRLIDGEIAEVVDDPTTSGATLVDEYRL